MKMIKNGHSKSKDYKWLKWIVVSAERLFNSYSRLNSNGLSLLSTVHLGENIIRRRSSEYEQTFRNIDNERPPQVGSPDEYAYNFCGCGWPQHLLVFIYT